ncbi:ABC transporter ATP-binding protein [Jeotgalibacillus marinus]|uniref:ABC transporter ATP-binding protein n=1 Tax=Jeotgalibacillus marinus TaxID=86667 RepID=A0ABV3Q745_9BACL
MGNIKPLLDVRNLKTHFKLDQGKVAKAVDGIDFSIHRGETLALVGESGSGKSITSLSIMQLIPSPPGEIVAGEISLDGKNLLDLSEREMVKVRGNEIGMIFQEPMTSLNPVFTVGNQVAEPLMKHKKMKKKAAYKKAIDILKLVGFPRAEEIIHEYPHQLSGGMRQRVMIAMAISCGPRLLIADEPTTALDVTIQQQILDLMIDLKTKVDSSILMITHDLGVVAEVADRVIVMYAGQIVEEAPVYELFTDPKHPYTVGLLGSMPTLEGENKKLESIPGMVPPAYDFPEGCRFAPRCKHVMDQCTVNVPKINDVGQAHKVRCELFDGKGVSAIDYAN